MTPTRDTRDGLYTRQRPSLSVIADAISLFSPVNTPSSTNAKPTSSSQRDSTRRRKAVTAILDTSSFGSAGNAHIVWRSSMVAYVGSMLRNQTTHVTACREEANLLQMIENPHILQSATTIVQDTTLVVVAACRRNSKRNSHILITWMDLAIHRSNHRLSVFIIAIENAARSTISTQYKYIYCVVCLFVCLFVSVTNLHYNNLLRYIICRGG